MIHTILNKLNIKMFTQYNKVCFGKEKNSLRQHSTFHRHLQTLKKERVTQLLEKFIVLIFR